MKESRENQFAWPHGYQQTQFTNHFRHARDGQERTATSKEIPGILQALPREGNFLNKVTQLYVDRGFEPHCPLNRKDELREGSCKKP